jgi:hypothetical protein
MKGEYWQRNALAGVVGLATAAPQGPDNRELCIRPHVDRLYEAIQQCSIHKKL